MQRELALSQQWDRLNELDLKDSDVEISNQSKSSA